MAEYTDETELLRTLSGDPTPSPEQRATARRRLDDELLADRQASRGQSRRWLAFGVALGAVVVTAGFFLLNAPSEAPQDLPLAFDDPTASDPTESPERSTYGLYVESIRMLDPVEWSDGAVIRTEQTISELSLDPDGSGGRPVAMINRRRIEGTWTEGKGVLVTVQDPPTLYGSDPTSTSKGPDLEFAAGASLPVEEQRTTTVDTLDTSALPTDPDFLEVALNALLDTNQQQPKHAQLFQLAETLNTPSQVASHAFRSALLEVLGALDVEKIWHADGTMSLSMVYADTSLGPVAQTLTFDPNGYLVRSSIVTIEGLPLYGVPALSEIRVMTQNPPEIAESVAPQQNP